MRYLFLRENVLFMVNIRFHRPEPHWTPYNVYTKYFLALTIVSRVMADSSVIPAYFFRAYVRKIYVRR